MKNTILNMLDVEDAMKKILTVNRQTKTPPNNILNRMQVLRKRRNLRKASIKILDN